MAQVAAVFTANISPYTNAMSKMRSATANMSGSVTSTSSKVASGLGTISKVSGLAGAATVAMGVKALKSYGTFQQSLNKAAIIAGGTSKDIGKLSDMANRMGAELPLSAQDAADAMVAMAQDGASIKTITKEFPAIAQAATATGADLQTTAGTVQQSMNIWGDSLKSPQRAAAILTQTANLSNASIEDMSGAISNIGGVAKNAGYGMGDMTEAVGLLTNRGFTAQRASQDLAHAILQMQAPSDKAAGEMKKLGLTFTDSSGKMKPFPQILREVAKATDGMTSSQKAAALKTMFNTAGMQAMLPLLDSVNDKSGNTATSWDAYAKALNNASSTTGTATNFLSNQAAEMQKNIGSKIEQVGGNWEAMSNKAMEAKGGVNGAILDMINKTLEFGTKSNSSLAQAARGFIGLSPVIGGALVGISGFTGQLNTLVIGVKNAGGMMKFLGGAINLPIIAIGALVAAFAVGYTKSETFRNAINNIGKAFVKVFNADWFKGVVSQIGSIFNDLIEITTSVFTGVAGSISGISWETVFGAIRAGVDIALSALKAVTSFVNQNKDWLIPMTAGIAAFVSAIKTIKVIIQVAGWIRETITIVSMMVQGVGVLKGAWTGLTAVLGLGPWGIVIAAIAAVVAALVTFFTKTETGKKMWSDFTTWLGETWQGIKDTAANIWNGLGEFFSNLWPSIVSTAQGAWQGLNTDLQDLWTGIVNIASTTWNGLVEFFTGLWTGITTTASTMWTSFTQTLSGIWQGILTTAQAVWQPFGEFFSTVWTGIQNTATQLWTNITGYLTNTWNSIKEVAGGVWEMIKSVISAPVLVLADIITGQWDMIKSDLLLVWNGLKDGASQIWNGIKDFFSNTFNSIKSTAINVWNNVKSTLTNIWNGAVSVGKNVWNGFKSFISGLWNGIKSLASSVWNGIKSTVTNTVNGAVNGAKSAWNNGKAAISNIWNGMKSAASNAWNGMKSAIGNAAQGAKSLAQNAWSGLRSATSSAWSGIKSVTSSTWNGMKSIVGGAARGMVSAASSAWSGMRSAASNAVDSVRNAFQSLSWINLWDAGRAIMDSFFSGLQATWGKVQNFVSGIASWIRKHKGPINYDAKLLIPAGNAIMGGLNKGLMNSFRDVQSNVSSMAGELMGSMNDVARDMSIADVSMQGANYQGGDLDQHIDTDNWTKPTFIVHNELVGDKIKTIINNGNAQDSIANSYFI